jgi:ABC-type transport system involved in cytochrome c biogenesis permease subunit
MNSIIDLLTIVLPFLYGIVVWAYAKKFFKDVPEHRNFQPFFLIPTVMIHGIYLFLRTIEFDHVPITTVFEIMTMISFSIVVVYLIVEYTINVKGTGFFILLLALLFQIISSLFIEDLLEVKQVLRNRMLGFHVFSAIIGYIALGMGAIYGFLYIMLYHNIKAKRFNVVYSKLPNLEILERMTAVSIGIGFVFLGIAIAVGIVWLPSAFETFSYFDPKLILTVCIWAFYGAGLLAKQFSGLQGRRFMLLAIIGFAVSFLSLTFGNIYFTEFHNFY